MLRTKHSARRSSSRRFWTGMVFTLLLILAAIVGGWFYALQRAHYQPEWYESVQTRAAAPSAADAASFIAVPAGIIDTRDSTFIAVPTPTAAGQQPGHARVADGARKIKIGQSPADAASIWLRVQRDLEQKGQARVAAFELVPLFVEMLKVQGRPEWAALVKAGKSRVHRDRIVSETILDLRQVPVQQPRSKAADAWNMVQQMIPKDRLADVYLKVDARPRVERGYLRLDDGSSLSVGKIVLPVTELEKRFNVPLQVEMDRFMFNNIEIGKDQLVLIR